MKQIRLKMEAVPAEKIPEILAESGICLNRYAETYMAHPRFSSGMAGEMRLRIASLQEIGLEEGGTLEEVSRQALKIGLKPCPPDTGLYLRLAWKEQPASHSLILSGTHEAPEGAVTVFSEAMETDDDFPKGLYLRNVDGRLWLRGYICDGSYRFPGDALFAFKEKDMEYSFRLAQEKDCGLILSFIQALADYEKMSDQVVATEELLAEWIFGKKKAEVLFVLEEGREVGFALFFHNFSTFLGRAGLYLEDLFVLPEYRGKGYGKALLKKLAQIALERGCGRMEWWCLDWNQPSIDFYLSAGARPMDEWTVFRLTGESLENLAKS